MVTSQKQGRFEHILLDSHFTKYETASEQKRRKRKLKIGTDHCKTDMAYIALFSACISLFINDLHSTTTEREVLALKSSLDTKIKSRRDPQKAKQRQIAANFKQANGGEIFRNMDRDIQEYRRNWKDAAPHFVRPLTDWNSVFGLLPLLNGYSVIATPLSNLTSILKTGINPGNDGEHAIIGGWYVDIDPRAPRDGRLVPAHAVPRTSQQIDELFRKFF